MVHEPAEEAPAVVAEPAAAIEPERGAAVEEVGPDAADRRDQEHGAEPEGQPACEPAQDYGVVRYASQSSLAEAAGPAAHNGPAAAHIGPAAAHNGPAAAHSGSLLSSLSELRSARLLTDVMLYAVQDTEGPEGSEAGGELEPVAAHRCVLAAASPYFRAMFTAFQERARPAVTIRGIDPAALRSIVRYIYEPSSLRISEQTVQALLAGASLLQVQGARDAAAAFLQGALQPDNALGILSFAEQHGCDQLAATARAHVDTHGASVLRGDEWLQLDVRAAAALLARDELQLGSGGEEVALDAAVRWARHEPQRLPLLGDLLEQVRLPLVGREALVSRAAAEPLVSADLRVKDLVIEALSFHLLRGEARLAAARRLPRARPRPEPRAPPLLLVVGGQAPKAVRAVEALELETGSWRALNELPTRRCRAGLATVGSRVLVVGGFNGALRVRSVDVYDAASDQWAPGPPLGARRSTLGVAVIGPLLYAVGGFDGAQGLSSAEVLDAREPGAGWRAIAPMSTRRSSVGVAALNGRVYAVGGYDGAARQCLQTVERYCPATDTWERAEDMAARRSGAAVAALDGALYAAGGHDGPAVRRSVERYTQQEGWSPAPPMGCARRNAGAAAHQGRLYVVGGDDGQANLSSVEVLDVASGIWTTLTGPMALGRSYAGVCVVSPPA